MDAMSSTKPPANGFLLPPQKASRGPTPTREPTSLSKCGTWCLLAQRGLPKPPQGPYPPPACPPFDSPPHFGPAFQDFDGDVPGILLLPTMPPMSVALKRMGLPKKNGLEGPPELKTYLPLKQYLHGQPGTGNVGNPQGPLWVGQIPHPLGNKKKKVGLRARSWGAFQTHFRAGDVEKRTSAASLLTHASWLKNRQMTVSLYGDS